MKNRGEGGPSGSSVGLRALCALCVKFLSSFLALDMNAPKPTLHRERRRSREIFDRAAKLLVGGVNSPVRAFRSVGGDPLIIERGEGQYLYDADGNQLLDFVCSWGAILLGHANPAISGAIAEQAKRGTSFGVTTELEIELAALI